MAVVIQTQPWRTLALIKYFEIILELNSSFLYSAWLKYDELFYIRVSLDPTFPRDNKDMDWEQSWQLSSRQHLARALIMAIYCIWCRRGLS